MKTYEALAGQSIQTAAKAMIALAVESQEPVLSEFNGIVIVGEPQDSYSKIVTRYHEASKKQHEEYLASPEGKKAAADSEDRRLMLQKRADALMAALPHLVFTDVGEVLEWFCAAEEPRDHIGVTISFDTIRDILAAHGYEAGANCSDDFKEDDRENFARWIIGQALSNPCPPLVNHFANKWRERFEAKP